MRKRPYWRPRVGLKPPSAFALRASADKSVPLKHEGMARQAARHVVDVHASIGGRVARLGAPPGQMGPGLFADVFLTAPGPRFLRRVSSDL